MLMSVVIPCYKSEKTIFHLVSLINEEFDKFEKYEVEIILVNDASNDGTLGEIKRACEKYNNVIGIDLAKNFGQHNAILAGFHYISGEYVIGMDDDMQTHPSQLKYLINEIMKGYDVVYGYYPHKKHGFMRNLGSKFHYFTSKVLLGKSKDVHSSSYWIMKRFVAESIKTYPNASPYLQGLILRTTRNVKSIPIQHFEREYGTSTYTTKALIRLWSNILGFSIVPLRMASYMGYFFFLTGVLGAVAVAVLKFINPGMAIGWPSIMCAMLFFFGINLLFLGLVGEYVGRIFLSLNKEPQYIIRNVYKSGERK